MSNVNEEDVGDNEYVADAGEAEGEDDIDDEETANDNESTNGNGSATATPKVYTGNGQSSKSTTPSSSSTSATAGQAPKAKLTKKAIETNEMARGVIENLLQRDEDEFDFALHSIAMRMKKQLNAEQREACLDELHLVLSKHVKQAINERRFGMPNQGYMAGDPAAPGVVRVGEYDYQSL